MSWNHLRVLVAVSVLVAGCGSNPNPAQCFANNDCAKGYSCNAGQCVSGVGADGGPGGGSDAGGSSVSDFTEFHEVDWIGNDLTSMSTMTLDGCASLCRARADCVVFTFSLTAACSIKGDLGDPSSDMGNSYLRNSNNPVSAYSLGIGLDYPGNDLMKMQTAGPIPCAKACDSTSGCVGFVMGTSKSADAGTCWLKSGIFGTGSPNASRMTYASDNHGPGVGH
jgi:hypothetical protein